MMNRHEPTELDFTALRIDLHLCHLRAHGRLRSDLVILIPAFDDDRCSVGFHDLAVGNPFLLRRRSTVSDY